MIDLVVALGLVFVLEGLVLFVFPPRVKQLLETINQLSEKKIRLLGLLSISIGILIIAIIRF